MRQPDIYSAECIQQWPNSECVNPVTQPSYWRPARPEGHNAFSFRWRWKLAFYVLIGRYDALNWDSNRKTRF